MRKIFIAVLAVMQLMVISASYAEVSKVEYELQERCGKRTEEWFRSEWGTGITGQAFASYRNHFNANLNKCLILITYQDFGNNLKKQRTSTLITLFDINESKEYGNFFMFDDQVSPSTCRVGSRTCASEAEWKSLVAPYMGD